jgi:general stress protein 26
MSTKTDNGMDENREDLRGPAAMSKLREIVDTAKVCFFCTQVPAGDPGGARPMTVREVDEDGNLWFLSASDSSANQELARNPSVRLFFQGSDYADFMQLNGQATVSTDRERIHQLWTKLAERWFTGGKDDPRVTVIKVEPTEGYYWDTQGNIAVSGIKMVIGAVLRKPMEDSVQGKLDV